MATYDYVDSTDDQFYGHGSRPHAGGGKIYEVKRTVNVATAAAAMGLSAFTAADVLTLINIPAQTRVLGVGLAVDTAGTTASVTYDVGDGDDPNGWLDGLDATDATVDTYDITYANGGSVGDKDMGYYATADTIDVVLADAAASDGVFTVWVDYIYNGAIS